MFVTPRRLRAGLAKKGSHCTLHLPTGMLPVRRWPQRWAQVARRPVVAVLAVAVAAVLVLVMGWARNRLD